MKFFKFLRRTKIKSLQEGAKLLAYGVCGASIKSVGAFLESTVEVFLESTEEVTIDKQKYIELVNEYMCIFFHCIDRYAFSLFGVEKKNQLMDLICDIMRADLSDEDSVSRFLSWYDARKFFSMYNARNIEYAMMTSIFFRY